MNVIFKKVVLLGLFFAPLVPDINNLGYEHSKVIFLLIYILVTAVIWEASKHKFKWTKIKLAQLFFILSLWVGSLLGKNIFYSILGKDPYFQGALIYSFLFLFAIFVSNFKISLKEHARTLVFSALVVAAVALIQFVLIYFHYPIPTYAGRVVSTFGQPNFYAGFLFLTLPFLYLMITEKPKLYLSISLIILLGILVSFSRTAIFMSLGLLLIILFKTIPKKSRVLFSILTLSIFIAAFLIAFKNSTGILYQEFIEPQNNLWNLENSPEKRVFIIPAVFNAGLNRPLFGYGLENLDTALSLYLNSFKVETTPLSPQMFGLKNIYINRSHNFLLDIFVFSGVLGVLSYLFLILMLFFNSRNSMILFSALLIYFIWVQFQNQSIAHLLYFFLIAGLVDEVDN